jgi:uncharacterized protein
MTSAFRGEQGRDRDSPQAACGEGAAPFHIDREGRWWHEGGAIGRKELVRLFATVLRREADGRFWLVTPVERVPVTVEDSPFVAVELCAEGEGEEQNLRLRTNLDHEIPIDAAHPLELRQGSDGVPVPYVRVRAGLDARLSRPVYYDLVDRGVERDGPEGRRFGVWSAGRFFPLGTLGA